MGSREVGRTKGRGFDFQVKRNITNEIPAKSATNFNLVLGADKTRIRDAQIGQQRTDLESCRLFLGPAGRCRQETYDPENHPALVHGASDSWHLNEPTRIRSPASVIFTHRRMSRRKSVLSGERKIKCASLPVSCTTYNSKADVCLEPDVARFADSLVSCEVANEKISAALACRCLVDCYRTWETKCPASISPDAQGSQNLRNCYSL